MPNDDHLTKIRDAIDEFFGDGQPGTLEIDRPGKTDMVIITKEAFELLVNAEARLNEIEGNQDSDIDHGAILHALANAKN